MCYSFCGKKSKKFSKFWKKWKNGIEFATQKEKKRELDECEKEKMKNKKSQRNDVLFLWNLWKKNQREEKGLFETSWKNKSTLNTTNVKRSQGAQDRFSDDLGCDNSIGHQWERSKWCIHKPKEIWSAPIRSKEICAFRRTEKSKPQGKQRWYEDERWGCSKTSQRTSL